MGSANPIRILIVSGKDELSGGISVLLKQVRSCSYDLRTSADIEQALTSVNSGHADAVCIEIPFKEKSPANIIEKFRNCPKPVPVIVIAKSADEQSAIQSLRDGAQDYLITGDFDGETFSHVIRSAMERHRVSGALDAQTREFDVNEARLLNVVSGNADGILVVDSDGIVRFMNPAAQKLFGTQSAGLTGNKFPHPVKSGANEEINIDAGDNKTVVAELRAVDTAWDNGKALLVSVRDITLSKNAEITLRKSEERYALAMRGTKDGLWDWNLLTDEVFFSQQWKSMLGCDNSEIRGTPNEWFKRVHKEDIDRLRGDISAHLAGMTPHFSNEHRLLHRDGVYRWMLSRGTAVRDAKGKAVRIAGSQSDITERKEAEKNLRQAMSDLKYALASEKVLLEELDKKNRELVELSITDGLTGLFNHRFIQERFDFEFKRAKRYGILLSCMLIDIDHFKLVNDNYGHQFGDYVLREIAGILKKNSRDVDICGRYGGEEFMVITNQDEEGVMRFATKLHKMVEEHPFESEGQSIKVTVSIGVTTYSDSVLSKHEMIERADTALYKAKEDGRNLIRVWKPAVEEEQATVDQGGIEDLKEKFRTLSSQMRATYMESTDALLRAVDAKDHYTYQHSQNVSMYAVDIGTAMGISSDELEVLKYAGLLHDIGKIGVDESILVKKDSLTYEEFEILKKHPVIGENILKNVQFLENELPIILHHHERYDGTGYPQGLREREIPMGARILGVADAYDAMTTDREFKRRLSMLEAIDELNKGKGSQFSPEVVDAFISVLTKKQSD